MHKVDFPERSPDAARSPDELIYDSDTHHWQFPSAAIRSDEVFASDDAETAVPRENVYSVLYERRRKDISGNDVADRDAEVAFHSLPGEYAEVTSSEYDFLTLPRYDTDRRHWEFTYSNPSETEGGERIVVTRYVPRERVLYVTTEDGD